MRARRQEFLCGFARDYISLGAGITACAVATVVAVPLFLFSFGIHFVISEKNVNFVKIFAIAKFACKKIC